MERKNILIISVVLVVLAAAALALKGGAPPADPRETVRIGVQVSPIESLVFIAEAKGFFTRHGVSAVVKDYETGTRAVRGLLDGAVDVAQATEFILARQGFDHDNLRTFAGIANTRAMSLIARRDGGIEGLPDLRGKRIGVVRGSISEFFLGDFLRKSNIPLAGVKIVDLTPAAMEEGMCNGSVAAVVTLEPHTTRIEKRLGNNMLLWQVPGRDDYYHVLVAKEAFLRRSPRAPEKLLRALLDAEAFARERPGEALAAVAQRLKLPPEDVQLVLEKTVLQVRLDQGLLTLMEAEAQWMIRNNLVSKREMPNYLDMIYWQGLETIKPEAVGIIH